MNIVADMLLREPAPAAIWAALMLLALPALVLLASPIGLRRPRAAFLGTARAVTALREQRHRRVREAEEIIRYAAELHAAAERAEAGARRWQEHRQDAEQLVEDTWQAWQAAQARLERVRGAAAFRNPYTVPSPAEYAARERWLHQAVRAAAERGDLPATAVADALAGRGWDATLHPFEQELAVLRAVAEHHRARHHHAVATEQNAWHDAHLARRTADDLRREAANATVEATAAARLLPSGGGARRARAAVAVRTA
ncbi:hypothetical protein [Actinoplanes sp. N902-109]|uniref:hypothetical protein n=1 Tax=Actinoplanes sp. (strain N902-109) TaxID=649831 RepID=UPI00032966E6|nr:hypothetical protein [Actinoplanes sp. N902-109]AGL17242.1 hypothetical protein L083_3732 [Actinoplanes sp. N902-109]